MASDIQITLNDFSVVENKQNFVVCEVEQVVVAINNGNVYVQSRYGNQYKVELCSTLSVDTINVSDHLIVRRYKDGRWVAVKNIGNPNKQVSTISSKAFDDAFMNY